MAVCKVNLISIIGPSKKLDELVNVCGESGVFQPDSVGSFYSNTQNFLPVSEQNPYSSLLMELKNSIYSCGGKTEVVNTSGFHVSRSKMEKYVKCFSSKVNELMDKKRAAHAKIAKHKEEIEKLRHFLSLDKTLEDVLSCEYIKAKFGKMPMENYLRLEEVSAECEKQGIELLFFKFDADKEYVWGVYFADMEHLDEIDRVFSGMYFSEVELTNCPKTPRWRIQELERECKDLENTIKVIESEILAFWNSQKQECMKFFQKIEKLSTYFEIKSYAATYGNSFILVGWVPQDDLDKFKESISAVEGIEYSVDKGSNLLSKSPPVKLKNRNMFKPFEALVEMYGMPCYNEMDPTAFVAITYPILFGIMFADLGQGLLVALIGWFMCKFKGLDFGKVLIPCGISSAIFGTLFGSVFGFEHVLDPLYKAVFGLPEKPIEVMSASATNMIIYSAVALGILFMIISMILGAYASIKRGSVWRAVFSTSGVCGITFYCSVIYMILNPQVMSGSNGTLYLLFLIILPVVLIAFKEILIKALTPGENWKPKSWGEYLTEVFFELFEMLLSYLSNTMSFLRVGAFVLAHAGMMMAVFTLAEMMGGIGYVLTVIVGNLIVTALEALLAGIQGLRLEFYEMFGKFFEGQGRPFSPIVYNKKTNKIN